MNNYAYFSGNNPDNQSNEVKKLPRYLHAYINERIAETQARVDDFNASHNMDIMQEVVDELGEVYSILPAALERERMIGEVTVLYELSEVIRLHMETEGFDLY